MRLITSEVYDYILDDVQQRAVNDQERMKDVVEHLKLQSQSNVKIEQYIQKAEGIVVLLKQAAIQIDDLPQLGINLDEVVAGKSDKPFESVITLTQEEAIELVGNRMTQGAMAKALTDHYGNVESVEFDSISNKIRLLMREM